MIEPEQPKNLDVHPDDPTLVFRKGRWTKRRKQSRYEEIDGRTYRLCTCCDQMLPIDLFAAHGKTHRSQCKVCRAPKDKQWREQTQEQRQQYQERYYQRHAERIKTRSRTYAQQNEEKVKEYQQRYYEENRNDILEYSKQYYIENKDRVIQYIQQNQRQITEKANKRSAERKKRDPQFKISCVLRTRLNAYLKYYRGKKSAPTFDLLGCSIDDFVKHLQSLFWPGMNWDNYGKWRRGESMKWVMDHIRPCSSFDLTNPEQQRQCFHYTNIQPLWDLDNIIKNDRLDWTPTINGR